MTDDERRKQAEELNKQRAEALERDGVWMSGELDISSKESIDHVVSMFMGALGPLPSESVRSKQSKSKGVLSVLRNAFLNFRGESVDVVVDKVSQACDGALVEAFKSRARGRGHKGNGGHRARESFELALEFEDGGPLERFCFGGRMSFLAALGAAAAFAREYKDDPQVRVVLLEHEDGHELLDREDGQKFYGPREVTVFRSGINDPTFRPIPGRRATGKRR